ERPPAQQRAGAAVADLAVRLREGSPQGLPVAEHEERPRLAHVGHATASLRLGVGGLDGSLSRPRRPERPQPWRHARRWGKRQPWRPWLLAQQWWTEQPQQWWAEQRTAERLPGDPRHAPQLRPGEP